MCDPEKLEDHVDLNRPRVFTEQFRATSDQKSIFDTVVMAFQPVTLVLGPPGSSKTFTISLLVHEYLRRLSAHRVLVTAPSNLAVDRKNLAFVKGMTWHL